MSKNVYILGGAQTDFIKDYTTDQKNITDLFKEITELPLGQCLLYLAYEKEKIEYESAQIKSKF